MEEEKKNYNALKGPGSGMEGIKRKCRSSFPGGPENAAGSSGEKTNRVS